MMGSDDGPAEFTAFLAPTADLVIDRAWDTAGMRATGSHTLGLAEEIQDLMPSPTLTARLQMGGWSASMSSGR